MMDYMKARNIFFLMTASLLVGCLQEDPQIQALRNERDDALARIQKLVEDAKVPKPESQIESANLQKEVVSLKGQLNIALAEVKKAKESTQEPLSEEELLVLLRSATEEHRKPIRERFDVVNIVLSEFSMPEKMAHPYRCGVQYDLVEKSTGEPYYIDVAVSAPPSGMWEVPPVSEFESKIKKGSRTALVSSNPLPNRNSQSSEGAQTGQPIVTAGNQPTGGMAGTIVSPGVPVNSTGQMTTGAGQLVTGLPGAGGPGVPIGSGFQQPQVGPAQPTPELSGPGLGNISKKLKVDW